MKIYTKTGDRGETGLFGGERVPKDHPRIVAYGDVDELNSVIGFVRSCQDKVKAEVQVELDNDLKKIQNDLFNLGAMLATPDAKRLKGKDFVTEQDAVFLEEAIDRLESELKPLQTFILPGGHECAARLHMARTICRRAERHVVVLAAKETIDPNVIIYLNRLSDFLFVLARWVNQRQGVGDSVWEKKT